MISTPELKVAVDYALCSISRHRPDIFGSLLSSLMAAGPAGPVWTNSTLLQRRSVMETLARASQSDPALDQLARSGLLDLVSRTISGIKTCSSSFISSFLNEFIGQNFAWPCSRGTRAP